MENIVIMLKNKQNGFLEQELAIIPVEEGAELISGIYADDDEDGLYVHLMLTCSGDVSDEDFERIYDEYGDDLEIDESYEIFEAEGFNPSWEIVFPYNTDRHALETSIRGILSMHMAELERISNRGC